MRHPSPRPAKGRNHPPAVHPQVRHRPHHLRTDDDASPAAAVITRGERIAGSMTAGWLHPRTNRDHEWQDPESPAPSKPNEWESTITAWCMGRVCGVPHLDRQARPDARGVPWPAPCASRCRSRAHPAVLVIVGCARARPLTCVLCVGSRWLPMGVCGHLADSLRTRSHQQRRPRPVLEHPRRGLDRSPELEEIDRENHSATRTRHGIAELQQLRAVGSSIPRAIGFGAPARLAPLAGALRAAAA